MTLSLACPDWFERLRNGLPPIADIALNNHEADSAEGCFRLLRLPDVPNQPLMGQSSGNWGPALVRHVFGAVETGAEDIITSRFIRKYFVLIPKKNAKTTNGAAIMMVAMMKNKRPNAEFLLVGPTQAIADTAFAQATGMIEADTTGFLKNRFRIRDHKKEIEDIDNGAVLKIKTFDNKVMTGVKPVGVLIDELHELGKISYASKVLTQIRGGIIANPEGFLIYITTQSDEPPTGAFKAELEYARSIRDGEIEGDMLPMTYEFPTEVQADKNKPWLDPKVWSTVLPNAGFSIAVDTLVGELKEAQAKGLEETSLWASQHLNIEIGIAMHKDRWEGTDLWLNAADPETITFDSLMDRCDVATVGIDGGGLDDLLGLSVCGRDKITRDWLFWFKAWAHPSAIEQRKESTGKYEQFAKEGNLVICDYPTQDIDELTDHIVRLNDSGLLPEKYAVGLDPVGVAAITDALSQGGITEIQMTAVPQGYKLTGVIKGFARRLQDGRLWHDGSAMMIWVVGNAKKEQRGNAVLITKQISGVAKIDPLLAGFNAFSLMERNPEAAGLSVYQGRGALVI